jgi:hypothetical protein
MLTDIYNLIRIFALYNTTLKIRRTGPNKDFVVLSGQLAAGQEGVAGGGNTYTDS